MKKVFLGLALLASSTLFASGIQYNTTTGTACYKHREIMYPLDDVFDALKQTLMQSNLNIVTVTKRDGILLAKGSITNNEEDTITSVTMTIDFKERTPGLTSVKTIASYSTQEKQNNTGQLGGGGISLPIPVPLTGKYLLTGSGNIDDSLWYQGFFNSLEKILFENYMKYKTVEEPTTVEQPKEEPTTVEQPKEEPTTVEQPKEEPTTVEQP